MVPSPQDDNADRIGRRTPAKGVILSSDMPLILFCTVCAKDHGTWVAQRDVLNALHQIWQNNATAWLVGLYVLMPDHLHFLCCPKDIREGVDIERWAACWKDCFSKSTKRPAWRWQRGVFHVRMRSDAHYREKLDYIRDNPLAKGLVARPEDWPWCGVVHDLEAHIRSFGNPARE
jgi:REP-associated tyrosine transposase